MTDFTRIQYLLDQEDIRKQALHLQFEKGEISLKDYINNLAITNQELIAHFMKEGALQANNVEIVPDLTTRQMTLQEAVNRRFYNPEEDMTIIPSNISGLVKAPKFGVKHKINLV